MCKKFKKIENGIARQIRVFFRKAGERRKVVRRVRERSWRRVARESEDPYPASSTSSTPSATWRNQMWNVEERNLSSFLRNSQMKKGGKPVLT